MGLERAPETVNAELEAKVRELESTTYDLANLLDGTDVATVFLDRDRRVRRFTPAMRGLIELRAPTSDGRSPTSISSSTTRRC